MYETRLQKQVEELIRKNDNIADIMRLWRIVHIFAPTKDGKSSFRSSNGQKITIKNTIMKTLVLSAMMGLAAMTSTAQVIPISFRGKFM